MQSKRALAILVMYYRRDLSILIHERACVRHRKKHICICVSGLVAGSAMPPIRDAAACARISFVAHATLAVALFDQRNILVEGHSLLRSHPVCRFSRTKCLVSTSDMILVVGLSLHLD